MCKEQFFIYICNLGFYTDSIQLFLGIMVFCLWIFVFYFSHWFWVFIINFWPLVFYVKSSIIGLQLLVVGHWFLVIHHCFLVLGRRLSVFCLRLSVLVISRRSLVIGHRSSVVGLRYYHCTIYKIFGLRKSSVTWSSVHPYLQAFEIIGKLATNAFKVQNLSSGEVALLSGDVLIRVRGHTKASLLRLVQLMERKAKDNSARTDGPTTRSRSARNASASLADEALADVSRFWAWTRSLSPADRQADWFRTWY